MYSLKLCGNFVTFFFVFIFYIVAKGPLRGLSSKLLSLLFLFFFFLFFFWNTNKSLNSRRLATAATWVTLSFVRFTLQRNTWRARAGSFIPSRGRLFFCFSLFSSWNFALFFRITVLALAKVIRLLLALQREMCFTQNIRSRVTWKSKRKIKKTPNCIILCLCVTP